MIYAWDTRKRWRGRIAWERERRFGETKSAARETFFRRIARNSNHSNNRELVISTSFLCWSPTKILGAARRESKGERKRFRREKVPQCRYGFRTFPLRDEQANHLRMHQLPLQDDLLSQTSSLWNQEQLRVL